MNTNKPMILKAAGILSLLCSLLIVAAMVCFALWPWPDNLSMQELFRNLQENPLTALISLDLLMVVTIFLNMQVFIILYYELRKSGEFLSLCAIVLGMIAAALIFTIRPLHELYKLSSEYSNTVARGASGGIYLTAGTTLMSLTHGTAWFMQTLLLIFSGMSFSILMLKNKAFKKRTGITGIAVSILGLGFMLPVIGKMFLLLNTLGSIAWYLFVSLDFFRMYRKSKNVKYLQAAEII